MDMKVTRTQFKSKDSSFPDQKSRDRAGQRGISTMRSCSRSHWSEPGEQGTISAVMVVGALFLLAGFILHFPTESGTETEPPARQCAEISVIEGSARSLRLVYPNDTFWKLLSEGMFTPDENETCFWRERHALYGIGGPSAHGRSMALRQGMLEGFQNRIR